ncbi:T5orf172 domain containing protein [Pyrenophora tritici-repentis]|uniref:Bacteriophage T5 Orf172 DNA-binding domain-containing protein n=1 Tax=Pyrenophora tritici-repentis TaxID=45151 RepID=A0A922NDW3_9PLEO|nr:hypothetical protein Ptr86124_007329 [Pyrenophora tritici-repentis]KAI1688436.1 T5orf172 domain containing protein [Pyrenophora tritici-repentis]
MFTGRTPESLIPRSDSRNPATTCKGITKSGRPCRRPIDAKTSNDNGVIAVVPVGNDSDEEEIGAAAYFCWQHKDQAEQLAAQTSSGPATQLYPLKERNSIDTLVERLGVLDVNEPGREEEVGTQPKKKKERRPSTSSRPPRRVNRPPTWDTVQGPLMSVPNDLMAKRKDHIRPSKPSPQRKKQSFWSSLCCGFADNDDEAVILTPQHAKPRPDIQQAQKLPQSQHQRRRRSSSNNNTPAQPSSPSQTPPQKTQLHPSIPPHLSPHITTTLLAELSKPISPHDDEGYIYIFWLTPETAGPAPASTASSLLTPPSGRGGQRRTSDVMRQFSVKGSGGGGVAGRGGGSSGGANRAGVKDGKEGEKEKDTILLKIGRANNVHRRMNEWSRQCGYSLSLVRYYPYVPSCSPSPSPAPSPSRHPASSSPSPTVRKVPHAMRVERLIHLELSAQRVIKQCEACGKAHKEWFEVEASREGVRGVDEVVRRWVKWDEAMRDGQG